ncbi:hypothetical protein [Methanosphaera sp.]
MVKMNIDLNQTTLDVVKLEYNIPRDHIARFVTKFLDENYSSSNILVDDKKTGWSSFPIKSILKLIIYSEIIPMTSAKLISNYVCYHDVFKYIYDGLTPSERSINHYRKKNMKNY